MNYLTQLKLLVWKNFLLRKRQKIRCIKELIWPLCLFLLLLWVRSKGFYQIVDKCYYEDKPLPSAGNLLYYQSLICTLNNTCNKFYHQSHRDYSKLDSSRFYSLYDDINSFVQHSSPWNENIFVDFATQVQELVDGLSKFSHFENLNKNLSKLFYETGLKHLIKLQKELDTQTKNTEKILHLLNILENIDTGFDSVTKAVNDTPMVDDMFRDLHNFMCGNTSKPINLSMILAKKVNVDSFGQYSVRDNYISSPGTYEYDKNFSPLCNKIYEKFETSKSLQFLWRTIKPFARGKITFSPNTTQVLGIMKKLNETMTISNNIPKFELDNYAFVMNKSLYSKTHKNIILLKDLSANQQWSSEDIIMNLLQSNLEKTITKAEHYLQVLHDLFLRLEKVKEETFKTRKVSTTEILKCYSSIQFEGFLTEKEAELRSWELCDKNDFLAQISFLDLNDSTQLNPFTSYKIRMNSERLPRDFLKFNRLNGPNADPIRDLQLITYGFVYIQDIVEKSIIDELTGRTDTPGYILKQFPYPCHIQDRFMVSLADIFPLFMILSWTYTASIIIKNIVHEKEVKLKEMMYILGLNNGIHWLSWFIDSFVPMILTVCFLSIILVQGGILGNTDFTLVLIFLTIYSVATISQCFLISVLFSNANIASTSGGILFFMTYLPFPFIDLWGKYLGREIKIFFCLSSNVALGMGSKLFTIREQEGEGCTWSNWNKSLNANDYLSLDIVMIIMIIDTLIYMLLTWYLESVFPGNVGLRKRWHFPFEKKYWFPRQIKKAHCLFEDEENAPYVNEPEPTFLRKGVEIKNLSKIYRNGKIAVSNLTINFYENQITAFLGRNGSGKTTTISILAGLFPPTQGCAKINGWDICHNMSIIRQSLGICPQANVHFRHFTVEEHLWFFARLKGHEPFRAQIEIQKLLDDINMIEKKDCLSIHLSGGMRRKLSIAIAFIGEPRTVILDEPTEGIDPYSRKAIWDILLKYKKGRTIIMTTHNMSEAEVLGDRIAIIANGQVQCYGSSLFLKSTFGCGHMLSIDHVNEHADVGDSNKPTKDISKIIQEYVCESKLVEKIGTEIRFSLPKTSTNVHEYHSLFKYLEINKKDLGILSFGVRDTTLEEIFLKVVDESDANVDAVAKLEDIKKFEESDNQNFNITKCHHEMHKNFILKQFMALQSKRVRHNKRNVIALVLKASELDLTINENINKTHGIDNIPSEILDILGEIYTSICLVSMIYETGQIQSMKRCRPLHSYSIEQPKPVLVDHSICKECLGGFFEVLPTSTPWTSKYIDELTNLTGFGTKCVMKNGIRDDQCVMPYKGKSKGPYNNAYDCNCTNGVFMCPPCTQLDIPDKIILSSGHEMLNVTGRNISNWILNSWHCYEEKRVGGYTFGIDMSQVEGRRKSISPSLKNNTEMIKENEAVFKTVTTSDNIMIWFNSKWKLSPSVYLNNINNVILRASVPSNISHMFGIKLYIEPMNYTLTQYETEYRLRGSSALLHSVALIFALSFIPASFVMYLIEERVSKSKHLQFISGVNWALYWVQAFAWDMICYCFVIFIYVLCFVIFHIDAYINPMNLPAMITLLLLYGWATIPLMYPASFYFYVPSSAFVSLSCINIFLGVTTTAATHVLRVFQDEYLREIEHVLSNVLIIFPHFCLGEGIMKISESHVITTVSSFYNVKLNTNIYSINGLGKHYLSLFISGIIFFIFVLLLEKYHTQGACSEHKASMDPPIIDDADVLAERNRILNTDVHDLLVLKCLTKVYKVNKQTAVNQLCLGVNKGECFGLLGLNGAGKTTTFQMLTGDLSITFGDALIMGHSIRNEISSIRQHIGYCPQYDALDSLLTPKEHLEFYSDLRGIPADMKKEMVETCLKRFDLMKYKDVSTKYLSGGNKRKLSTAIAILGNTYIIFLDEPSSGMDPKGQRFLWSRIKSCVLSGRAVVLTSHSMNECEALCSRVTVMVNGQFKCLGSTQHLKNKYGHGYILTVKSPKEHLEKVKNEILLFPNTVEKSSFYTQMTFEVNVDIISLLKLFDILQALIEKSLVLDYSISQKSLEEIFLHFVQKNVDMKSSSIKKE